MKGMYGHTHPGFVISLTPGKFIFGICMGLHFLFLFLLLYCMFGSNSVCVCVCVCVCVYAMWMAAISAHQLNDLTKMEGAGHNPTCHPRSLLFLSPFLSQPLVDQNFI